MNGPSVVTVALLTLKEAFMVWCVAFGCSNGEKKKKKKKKTPRCIDT